MMSLAIMPLPTRISELEGVGSGTGLDLGLGSGVGPGEGIELGDIEAHEVNGAGDVDDAMLSGSEGDTFNKPRQ